MFNKTPFRYADFAKAGVSRVQVLNNTEMGRWLGCGQFILCYKNRYMSIEESMYSPGMYNINPKDFNDKKKGYDWRRNNHMTADLDVEDILSRFESRGVELKRDTYLGNPITIDYPTSSYSHLRSSVKKCYSLSSCQSIAEITTVDKIIVRKTFFDVIYKMWGGETVVFGKASHLPVVFGVYDDLANLHIVGVLMPISAEHRSFEENLNSFTKSMWEGIRV